MSGTSGGDLPSYWDSSIRHLETPSRVARTRPSNFHRCIGCRTHPVLLLTVNNEWMKHRSYIRISIPVAVVWAIILTLGVIVDWHVRFSGTTFDVLLMVFGGFVIGWMGGTIARARGSSTAPS